MLARCCTMYGMKVKKTFRLSVEAVQHLSNQGNQSQYVEDLILKAQKSNSTIENYILEMLDKIYEATKNGLTQPEQGNRNAEWNTVTREVTELGYDCCKSPKRCKHWQWDNSEVGWVNSLTGEIRD